MTGLPDAVAAGVAEWHSVRPDLDLEPVELGLRLRWLRRMMDRHEAQLAETHGLGMSEWWILATLRRVGPPHSMAPSELATAVGLTSSAVTKRMEALEQLGLVSRGQDHRDGRIKLVQLTDAGLKLADEIFEQELEMSRQLQSVLSQAERSELNRMLGSLMRGIGGPRA